MSLIATSIHLEPVKSNAYAAHGYDERARELHLRFHGGTVHAYGNFSPTHWMSLQNAESFGQHYAKHIRGKHPERKVS